MGSIGTNTVTKVCIDQVGFGHGDEASMKTDRLSILQWLATATGASGGWQFSTDGIFMTQTGPNGAISATPDHPTTFVVQPVPSNQNNLPVT